MPFLSAHCSALDNFQCLQIICTVRQFNSKKSLEAITKWLKQSDPKVNQEKTELCLFYKSDTTPIEICMGNNTVISKKERNVFGVTSDSK